MTYTQISTDDLKALYAHNEKMRRALKAVITWRNGPEGPDTLFEEGAKMIEKVRAALEDQE